MKFDNNIVTKMKSTAKFKNIDNQDLIVEEFNLVVAQLFAEIKDINDLLELINSVNKFIYKKSKSMKIQYLLYHAYHNKNRYKHFYISKKSGGQRTISAPTTPVKNIQTTLNYILSCVYKPQMPVHGFLKNRSVVTNAKQHVGKNYVYNIDLKNFFPSIHKARIEKRLQLPPFNLSDKRSEIATIISRLTTQKVVEYIDSLTGKKELLFLENKKLLELPGNKKIIENFNSNDDSFKTFAVLPQGAPTSPSISNFICDRLDRRLMGLAKRFNVKYTRYADDITFSSMQNVYQDDSEFIIEMKKIIADQNFEINPKKTRLQKRGYRQEVTGVIVNDKTNVNKHYIKQLRAMLYAIEKFGIEKAQASFIKQYKEDTEHVKEGAPDMSNVIYGKLEYLKMVKGKEDSTYLKLKDRFDLIINPNEGSEELTDSDIELCKKTLCKKVVTENIKHNPRKMVELLCKFTSEEPLKSITHPSRKNDEYVDFIGKVSETWTKLDKNYINKKLQAKIWRFLLDKEFENGWGKYQIKMGWSSPELKKWCSENPNKSPEDFEFNTNGEKTTFQSVINKFKAEIEISPSNNDLENALYSIVDEVFIDKNFDVEIDQNVEEAKFFIDTQWLNKGLELIFKEILTKSKYSKKIRIKIEQNKKFYDLKIIHMNSNSKMNPNEILERTKSGIGTNPKIIEAFNSICDVSIISSFHKNNFTLKLLSKKNESILIKNKTKKEIKHFIYVLRFYKCRM